MAVDLQYISITEIAQSLRSAQLEQLYQQALSQTERIYDDERARNLRVQLLLLEDENDELREQVDNDEDQLHNLESTNEELRDQLVEIESQYHAVQIELKTQLRDLDRYQTEVNALNAARVDATSLLSEKLNLSRELATLKPELEHLKAQSATQYNLLGQKLALERELSAVQVELETEKRAVQRLKAKSKTASSADNALTEEIEELTKELAKERRVAKEAAFKDAARVEQIEQLEQSLVKAKRDSAKSTSTDTTLSEEIETLKRELEKEKRKNQKSKPDDTTSAAEVEALKKELAKLKRDAQKAERESLKKATEWDSQKEVLEGKLDAFRNKLRTTKDELKEAQDELERKDQAKFAAVAEAHKSRLAGANPRKRNVARFDPDMTIGTPGHGGLAKKQRISVDPSEKSTFSITPFLNRTLSVLPESPDNDPAPDKIDELFDKSIEAAAAEVEKDTQAAAETTTKPKTTKKAPIPKTKATKPLQESTNPKANTAVKKATLSKVIEEDPEEVDSQQENTSKPTDKEAEPSLATKKAAIKRPTIFDDEDDAAPKKTKKLNLGGLKAGNLSLGKVNLGSKNKVLAEFSPLKKDRKAAVVI